MMMVVVAVVVIEDCVDDDSDYDDLESFLNFGPSFRHCMFLSMW